MGLRDFVVAQFQTLSKLFKRVRDKDVKSFADALEHNDAQWNPSEGVEHAEYLSSNCLGRAVTVT